MISPNAAFAVFAQVHHAACKKRHILQSGHAINEMMRQIHGRRIGRASRNFTVNMSPPYRTGLVWFRRDLRAHDHAALHHALLQCQQVHCVFVFDSDILDPCRRKDRRVEFIRESLVELDGRLRALAEHPRRA